MDGENRLFYHRHDEDVTSLPGKWFELISSLAVLLSVGRFERQNGEIWVSRCDFY